MTNAQLDEDEGRLYDRQIRLWGVTAQHRMRGASVLLVTLRGLAVEVAKNLVLAGIGNLTVTDDEIVSEDDLGSNYFLRDADVGQLRAHAALDRIQALNPRVAVLAASLADAKARINSFDLVCVTDASWALMVELNDQCRQHSKKFFAAQSIGLSGFIFADLIEHDFVIERVDRSAAAADGEDRKVLLERHQSFVPLQAIATHDFGFKERPPRPKALKRMLPLLEILAYISTLQAGNVRPTAATVHTSALTFFAKHNVGEGHVNMDRLSHLASMSGTDFAPTCAVLGGVLAQDILNALGGREAPLVNFFVLDSETNSGDIHSLGISRSAL